MTPQINLTIQFETPPRATLVQYVMISLGVVQEEYQVGDFI